MSLRIRRGTDAQRAGVTFLEGELIYTTDTKKMYVGDGSTVGGIAVDSTAGSINNLTDVNIAGVQVGQILQWDGSNFIPGDEAGEKDSIFGADSSILVDTTNSSINLNGTVKGHIIPDQNETYNLGSASNKFNDLFLSGTTITLGTATISSDGSEITLSQPIVAEVKSSGNVDTNDNSITNTAAGGQITVAPVAGKQFRVDDTSGGTSFSVDTGAKSVDIDNGYGLKLATFGSADYTALAGNEQPGQIVFDNPTKTLKMYNGVTWVQVAGSGGGSGVVEGQTYDININGDVVGDDSTIILQTDTKTLNITAINSTGVSQLATVNATIVNGQLKGNLLAADDSVMINNTTKNLTVSQGSITTLTGTDLDFNYVKANSFDGNLIGPDSTVMINNATQNANFASIVATELDVNGDAFADQLTVTASAFAVNFVASGEFQGNTVGNVKGSIKATGGQTILSNGTDGTDATFTGAVSGSLVGSITATGTLDGDLTGSVFGDDSSLLIDATNNKIVGDINTNIPLKVAVPDAYNDLRALQIYNFDGTFENPTAPTNFQRRSITWLNYDAGSDTFKDSSLIAGYHQTAGGGYLALTPVSTNNTDFFETAVELDGNAGSVKIAGGVVGSVQTISGPGAIDITSLHTEITTTGADAFTLANGVAGQVKIISMAVDGGDATLTPTTLATGTTITFDAVGDNVTLIYGANGWLPTAVQNAVIA